MAKQKNIKILLFILPYVVGRVLNYFFKLIPLAEDKVIDLIIDNFMFFYLGAFPMLVLLGIYLRIKEHYNNS